jgi:spore germination protein YaaH
MGCVAVEGNTHRRASRVALTLRDMHLPAHLLQWRADSATSMPRITHLVLAATMAGAMVLQVSPSLAAATRTPSNRLTTPTRAMDIAAHAAAAPASPGLVAQAMTQRPMVTALAATTTTLQREVFGFVNASKLGDSSVGYTSWNMALLSTVAFFSLQVNSGDGSLVQTTTGWSVYHSTTMSSFVNAAHSAGTKVVVSINLHDFSTDPNNQVCQGLQPDHATVTVQQTLGQVSWAGIDGVNIDYEGTDTVCANGQSSRAELDAFAQNMKAAMPKGSYLVIDTYSGSAEDNLEFFDISGLNQFVDAFFVMAYDMDYSNWSNAPLNCSGYCMNPVSPLSGYRFNVTTSMSQYKALVPANKIILGQPYYGRRACVTNLTDAHQNPLPNTNFASPTYIFASTISSQPGVSNLTLHRDPVDGASEWDTWYDSDWACNREQYFDDVNSLGAKYDLVNRDDIRGVGLFTLDYAGGSPEVWNLLASKFTTVTAWDSLGGLATGGASISSQSSSAEDAVVRGTDNGLWHNSWNGTAWAGWTPLGGGLASDPGSVSWSANRVDVFVMGTDRQLWHIYHDGGRWFNWEPLGGALTSGPGAASRGAGRLDVFVRGTDNQLWHKWWESSRWYGWEPLGGVLTSDPEVVSWGPNRLDVFARGTDGQLWHKWYDGTGWRGWEPLGGILTSGPTVASCGAGHLDVFAMGTDHGMWRLSFNGAWIPWQPQGGRFTSDPSAACRAGTSSLDVLERGIDYAVWHTTMPAA